ncbi:DUF6497 family protein [Pontibaca salina]|uniref:Acetolactate synthase n=1 Tax=Pontibaca salina TaxID=2795731 RepID=A0A934M392_9RHOB|nr:DUF6497 family protein [Pontibaca salina]MBI6629624.1 hypothetical protein [Pontibaca salina]
MAYVAPVWAQGKLTVPSGQPLELREVLIDENPGEPWLRFRFTAPEIAHIGDLDIAVVDMDHLCETIVLPYITEQGLTPARIVISFSDVAVEFGASDRDAIQLFEVYRATNKGCVWEGIG